MVLIVCLLGISAFITGCETIERRKESSSSRHAVKRTVEVFSANETNDAKVHELSVIERDETDTNKPAPIQPKALRTAADTLKRTREEIKALAIADKPTVMSYR